MREPGLHPPRSRRFVATTESDHDLPILPDRRGDIFVDGPNRLWVAELTYVAIVGGFVYVARIMDAWSRRIVGYALGRRIDLRLTLAALNAAIALPRPNAGCLHHSHSQFARASVAGRSDPHSDGPVSVAGAARRLAAV